MPGRPRKITPAALKLGAKVLAKFPGNPEAQNREIEKTLKVSPSTRKRIMRQARAGGKKQAPNNAQAKTPQPPKPCPKDDTQPPAIPLEPTDQPAGGLLAEIERARVANIQFYESIRDGVNPADDEKIWPSHRLAAAKALDKIYAFYPMPPDKQLSPEEQCLEVQEAMDAALGVGFTVTVDTATKKKKPKKKGPTK